MGFTNPYLRNEIHGAYAIKAEWRDQLLEDAPAAAAKSTPMSQW